MARKRKTLPKDFDKLLTSTSLDELKAVFDMCELDARGGYSKATAIGFESCPDALIVWLVEQGLEVDTPDSRGTTPLARRAFLGWSKYIAQIPLLLSLGADIEATDTTGQTPLQMAVGRQRPEATQMLLEHGASPEILDGRGRPLLLLGLIGTQNADIEHMAAVARLLFDRGATVTPAMREHVERIGRNFEFHRENFNADYLDATDAALAELYRLFGVAPVARRELHDGTSPITLADGTWQEQHAALVELLVPSSGRAATVQGEVMRFSGRIRDEMVRNGGANWNHDYRAMVDALPRYFVQGTPLEPADLDEARVAAKEVRTGRGGYGHLDRLSELTVTWVGRNPTPILLVGEDHIR